jgi:excisionase family DNA binding protein
VRPTPPKNAEERAMRRCISSGRLPATCTGNQLSKRVLKIVERHPGREVSIVAHAARELGITQARVRDLCRNGAIPAEMTDGGQFRIPREVLDKLKREGVPALPRPMPKQRAGGGYRGASPPRASGPSG